MEMGLGDRGFNSRDAGRKRGAEARMPGDMEGLGEGSLMIGRCSGQEAGWQVRTMAGKYRERFTK